MKKLLITENLKSIIEAGKAVLLRKGIEIFIASSAEEILNIHKRENVNLIISDLDITGKKEEGICAVLKDIRGNNALKKVSIITVCDNDTSAIAQSYACGANSFITKPIDSVELFGKIVKLIYVPQRVSLRVIVNVSMRGASNYNFFFANSENISAMGLLFVTDEVLEKDDMVTCSFFLGEDLLTTNGKVVRVDRRNPNQNLYGMQFVELSPSSKKTIETFTRNTTESNLS